ncbi:T9SS type A sorting domain-containing protein [Flavobacterium franklandianum]|uniref:T9SS type A sorting domain-containing protein n=2 Tax=Flavobacterium franklandianum TaxID=2594430 RepID=A0A553CPA1_9FLAO|nr:T9SS type A sorting domain-containing protein [Flavobacterium franklandianum]
MNNLKTKIMNKKLLLFVICLMTFSFANAQITSMAIVGAGAGGWPADPQVDAHQMTTADGGLHWTITNLGLSNGAVKFRANNEWNPIANWGGTTFPSGTGTVDGAAITAVAGIYNVTFNTNTLAYTFEIQQVTFQVISIIGDASPIVWGDTDMTTTDGNIYTLRATLGTGALKFRGDHSWTLPYNWGGTNFPSGTAVVDANGVIIPAAGTYDITFNKTTLAYSIKFKVISIFGDATPGSWTTDTDMTTLDGNNYTLTNVALISGALKFRGDHSWTLPYNWGGTTLPSGTAVIDANGFPIPSAGNYNINFNVATATYSISSSLTTKSFNTSKFSVYPNPAKNSWNFSSSNENIESIQIVDELGKTIRSSFSKSNNVTVDASGLTSGIYFAKIATTTGTKTLKLIKD